ncbi:CG5895 [Drosophila busckii]|uniref:CG5895 n=3 Tax=Drosophila busckii TaxID=30019 RepID=A0A0M4EJP6_DROBS|nr:CG5895 [Drosophila busckii]
MALWLALYIKLSTANCPVFLSISVMGKTLIDSCLELNWGPDCYEPPEWVGIYRTDPSVSNLLPELRMDGIQNRTGRLQTHIKLGKLHFPGGWEKQDVHEQLVPTKYAKGKCLPYYVASYRGNELLTVDCLKIQPNWLGQLKGIAELPIKHLFLPGTHASGAFIINYSKTKSLLVKDYLVAQHFDVWSQLVFGIRYLDLSVGFKHLDSSSEADNFWLVNENMFINPLVDVLRDVRRFVQRSGELVILDFSSFPIGFYKHPEVYSSLFHLIRQELGDVAYERNVSINEHCYERCYMDFKLAERPLLILFPTQELPHPENESLLLCNPWKRFSTSYMNISQTLDYMRLLFSKKKDSPVQDEGWIFHAISSIEQTLNSHKLQTAKERAALINPKINQWLKGPWGLNANIVALDYFSNTNIIDVVITANTHKAFLASKQKYINLEILE